MDAHPSRYSATVRVQQHRQVRDRGEGEGRGGEVGRGEGRGGMCGCTEVMNCVGSIQDRAKAYS